MTGTSRHRTLAPLGPGRLAVSRLGLGTAPLAGLFRSVPEADAVAAVECALDAGITYFDTAPQYGAGLAESRLGRALRGVPRGSVVVSTKVGRVLEHAAAAGRGPWVDADPAVRDVFDFSAAGVHRSLEASLERLGLDAVDVVYLHDPEAHLDQALAEALPALVELRDRGAVRAIGVGTNRADTATRFVTGTDVDVALVAGRYTLLDDAAEEALLPAAARRGVGIVAGGALNSGVLADPRPGATFDYEQAPAPILARARRLSQLLAGNGLPITAAALQFPARHPAVSSVLVGCRNAAEVRANVADFDRDIPDAVWHQLLTARAHDLARVTAQRAGGT